MGVYIKGMELPEAGDHVLLLHVYHDGTASIIGDHRHYKNEPFEVVPVPPHGRLIDADDIEHISINWEYGEITRINAPTIIPADPAEEGE